MTELAGKMQDLALRLKRLRVGLGLSQAGLSRAIGGNRAATVNDWERGRKSPDKGTLLLLAELTEDRKLVYRWLVEGGVEPPIRAVPGVSKALRTAGEFGVSLEEAEEGG